MLPGLFAVPDLPAVVSTVRHAPCAIPASAKGSDMNGKWSSRTLRDLIANLTDSPRPD